MGETLREIHFKRQTQYAEVRRVIEVCKDRDINRSHESFFGRFHQISSNKIVRKFSKCSRR